MEEIIQNDAILACQWADLNQHQELSGEGRLCLAVLQEALNNIARPTGPRKSVRDALAKDALEWLSGTQGYISFEHVCGMLGKDVEGFRFRLLRAIARHKEIADAMPVQCVPPGTLVP